MKHTNNVFICDFKSTYSSHVFVCDFKSTYAAALKNHTRLHNKQKWFQCNSCDYQTPSNGNLKTHKVRKHQLDINSSVKSELDVE